VSRPQQQAIGLGAEALERRKQLASARFHGPTHAGCPLQQIGTANVPGKDEIAGESSHRLRRGGLGGEQEGQVFRRMPGRMLHVQANITGANAVSVTETLHSRLLRKGVLPIRPTLGG